MERNKYRLKSLSRRADFLDLRATGRSLHINSWLLVNFKKFADLDAVQCGWTIPKQVGTAVVRNRLRRWGREFLRKWNAESAATEGLKMNVVFKRKEKGFYKALSHEEFDEGMRKMVGRLPIRAE